MMKKINRRQFGMAAGAVAMGAAMGCSEPAPAPAGPRVVILGGGFGGLTAARALRSALGREVTVTLVDRRPAYQMGLRKIWVLAGLSARHDGERPRAALKSRGVDVRHTEITGIDTKGRTVKTADGNIAYDFLLVALGAEPRPDLLPGWSAEATNLYDIDDCARLAPKLAALTRGRVGIAVAGAPYPCPPAPYEAAMTLDGLFRKRGVREQIEIEAWTLQPMSLPLMGKAVCDDFEARMAKKGIRFAAKRKTIRLEGATAVFEQGRFAADALLVVPPHRPPKVLKESGLCGAGEWVPIDRATMKTTADRVWAVGDCMEAFLDNKMPIPKAGVFAEAQAKVAAAGIVAEITGVKDGGWDGKGFCVIEHGGGEAARTTFDLFAPGGPKIVMPPPSAEGYREKQEFERERLETWFG